MTLLFASGADFQTATDHGLTSGASDGTVPVVGDESRHDSNSVNMSASAAVSCDKLNLIAGYTAIMDMVTHMLTLAAGGGLSIAAGTFKGGTNTNDINGPIALPGGTWDATSGVTEADDASVDLSGGGTFNHKNGEFFINTIGSPNVTFEPPTDKFFDFRLDLGSFSLLGVTGIVKIERDLFVVRIGNGFLGTWEVERNYEGRQGSNDFWTALIKFIGTGDQEIKAEGAGTFAQIPAVLINKASGSLKFIGETKFQSDNATTGGIEWLAGTIDISAATKWVFKRRFKLKLGAGLTDITIPVDIEQGANSLELFHDIIISGKYTVLSMGGYINTWTISLRDDISLRDAIGSFAQTATLKIDGTGAQLFDANSGSGMAPNFTIDKASGTLTMQDTLIIQGDSGTTFKYVKGDVVFDPGFILRFIARHKTIDAIALIIPTLEVDMGSWTLTTTGTQQVKKLLMTTSTNYTGGKIQILEELENNDTSTAGTTVIEFFGEKPIAISAVASNDFPNGDLIFNNKRGRATMNSALVGGGTTGDMKVKERAVLDLGGFALTVPNDLDQEGWIDNSVAGSSVTVTGTHTRRFGGYIGDTKQTRYHRVRNRTRIPNASRLKRAHA